MQVAGGALRPPPGAPQPVASGSSPRKAPASVIVNPTEVVQDDSGWSQQSGRSSDVSSGEYNPDEFTPKGPKPPQDMNLFAGDGIPSSGDAPASQATAGYE
jgi:hypothetical protein